MNTGVTLGKQLSLPKTHCKICFLPEISASINIIGIIIMLRSTNQHKIALIIQNGHFLLQEIKMVPNLDF